jgi:hypothetical protein
VAIDGSKFKAVNNRDRNFTDAKIKRRMERSSKASSVTWQLWTRPTAHSPKSLNPRPRA